MERVTMNALEASMETPTAAAAQMTGYLWYQAVPGAMKTAKIV